MFVSYRFQVVDDAANSVKAELAELLSPNCCIRPILSDELEVKIRGSEIPTLTKFFNWLEDNGYAVDDALQDPTGTWFDIPCA